MVLGGILLASTAPSLEGALQGSAAAWALCKGHHCAHYSPSPVRTVTLHTQQLPDSVWRKACAGSAWGRGQAVGGQLEVAVGTRSQ